jgi:hypothetical protein
VLSPQDFLLPAGSDSNNEFWTSLMASPTTQAAVTSAPPSAPPPPGMVPLDAVGQQHPQ